MRRKVS